MSRFVTTLRARPASLNLAGDQAVNVWTIRAQSAEAWDAVRMVVIPELTVREVKQAAMRELMPDVNEFEEYVVKLHGAELRDESEALSTAGVVDGSTLLVMSRRRRPVK